MFSLPPSLHFSTPRYWCYCCCCCCCWCCCCCRCCCHCCWRVTRKERYKERVIPRRYSRISCIRTWLRLHLQRRAHPSVYFATLYHSLSLSLSLLFSWSLFLSFSLPIYGKKGTIKRMFARIISYVSVGFKR